MKATFGSGDSANITAYAGSLYEEATCYQETFDGVSQFGRGRRTGMTDGSGSTSWIYDARGRVTGETKVVSGAGGGTFNTQWWYDALDRPAWQRYPGGNAGQTGEQVNFAYAPSTWLQSVSGAATYVGDIPYNALGQVTERRLGSTTGALRQLYTYTAAENFRLVSQQAGTAAPYTDLQNFTYTYDDTGNVLTISDAAAYGGSQTQTFAYDPLARLQTAQATGGGAPYGDYAQQSYGYSNAGNLTSFAGQTYAYNDAAHRHALTHIGGVQQYWYDANGNATRRITDATYDLTYDAENRLTQIQKNGGVSGTYVYDGDGNRVKETAGSTTTVYIGNYFEWTGDAATMKS